MSNKNSKNANCRNYSSQKMISDWRPIGKEVLGITKVGFLRVGRLILKAGLEIRVVIDR